MSQSETILGLSFGAHTVQGAVIRHDQPQMMLLAVNEWNMTIPSSPENDAAMDEVCAGILQYLHLNELQPDLLSVSLDSSRAFIATIPLEEEISRLERNDHIEWELSQYFPESSRGDFITDVQPITDNRIEKWVRALSVSIPKAEIDAVHKLSSKLALPLHVVDIDHFSADTALRRNYPDTARKFLALLGVKENRLDVSLMRNGVIESYTYFVINSANELIDHIKALPDEVKGLHSLTAYGTYLDTDLLVRIRGASSLLVEALNPLRHVDVSDSLRLADHLSVPSYRFVAAVGAALRRD